MEFGLARGLVIQLLRTGLVASEWHWSWDRDGATQVTLRLQRDSEGGREMTGYDWSTYPERLNIRVPAPGGKSSHVHSLGLYWQDKWRMTKKLTINLGLRYDPSAQETVTPSAL